MKSRKQMFSPSICRNMGDSQLMTIPVRVIRSFPHRNIRNLVLKDVDISITTDALIERTLTEVNTSTSLPPPFRKYSYDTLKVEHQAHGAKTSDPVINTEDDERLVLRPGLSLQEQGVRHETELSLFRLEDYLEYKKMPVHGQTQW